MRQKLMLAAVVWLAACPAHAAPRARRVVVPDGHGAAYLRGRLRGYQDSAAFVLHARRGRTLALWMARGGYAVVMVRLPDGRWDGAPGGIADVVPQTGDCLVTVGEHRMADPWRGPFAVKATLRPPSRQGAAK